MNQKWFDHGKFSKSTIVSGVVLVVSVISLISLIYYYRSQTIRNNSKDNLRVQQLGDSQDSLTKNSKFSSGSDKGLEDKNIVFYNPIPLGKGVQKIESILKENADLTTPILIKDSIIFSPHSPCNYGNRLEFLNNKPGDQFYFEKEHNTVWYKFIAKETGKLTFDIIPVNINDDYDFMLFKFAGNDFFEKVISKQIKPIRTCISRNNKKLKSMTGLTLDEFSESFIHSGYGKSYVKFIRVQKGEVFYLLLDNFYKGGDGHSIRFHYKPFTPGELYVGQLIPFGKITFKDSDTEFKPGSEQALDSLYLFLIKNPGIKIEIQGHVNASGQSTPIVIPGKPIYDSQQLSKQRAIAIYNFLVNRGIDSNRLTTVGYGSTRKKIPNPKTQKECIMNIRAEILILSLDYKKELEEVK